MWIVAARIPSARSGACAARSVPAPNVIRYSADRGRGRWFGSPLIVWPEALADNRNRHS